MFAAQTIIVGIVAAALVTYIVKRILSPVKCHISVTKPLNIQMGPIETDSLVTTKEYTEEKYREDALQWAENERQRLREAHAIREE